MFGTYSRRAIPENDDDGDDDDDDDDDSNRMRVTKFLTSQVVIGK